MSASMVELDTRALRRALARLDVLSAKLTTEGHADEFTEALDAFLNRLERHVASIENKRKEAQNRGEE